MSNNPITFVEALKAFFLNVCVFLPLCVYLFFYWGFWAGAALTRWTFYAANPPVADEGITLYGLFTIFNTFLLPIGFVLSFVLLILLFFFVGLFEFIASFFSSYRPATTETSDDFIEGKRSIPWKWLTPFAVAPSLLMFIFGCAAAFFSFQPALGVIAFYTAAGLSYGLLSYIFILIWCRVGYFHGFLAVVLEAIFAN